MASPQRRHLDVERLYTEKIDTYLSFNAVFRTPQALLAFFKASDFIRPDLRILDAGCGTGAATFALLRALRRGGLEYRCIHAFDLTPAMLDRFRQRLTRHRIDKVELRKQDVLELDTLPSSWTGYDLIVSVAMFEYLPGDKLPAALAALRARLAPHGRLLLFITRKNWITKLLIEKWWKANRYGRAELEDAFVSAGFQNIRFRRFPYTYFWQNQWAHVVEGRPGQAKPSVD